MVFQGGNARVNELEIIGTATKHSKGAVVISLLYAHFTKHFHLFTTLLYKSRGILSFKFCRVSGQNNKC